MAWTLTPQQQGLYYKAEVTTRLFSATRYFATKGEAERWCRKKIAGANDLMGRNISEKTQRKPGED
ncbi:MAG TPA: hypothetical protein VE986_02795 [Hyphomicrobiales bacterium]|nr:hypothetical protein [Hyphomicrobiales bacterium]